MNVNVDKLNKRFFSVEDVVSYSNVEITNANDNKPPLKIITVKAAVFCIIVALVVALIVI
jgi:hypothetical protein